MQYKINTVNISDPEFTLPKKAADSLINAALDISHKLTSKKKISICTEDNTVQIDVIISPAK